jgi:hypothetical protein
MRTLKILVIAAVIAMLAVPAMASIPLASGSCPVNLKIMPVATVVAPAEIDVAITTIDANGKGSSGGADIGTFHIGTNFTNMQIEARIGSPGLTGGTWGCRLNGVPAFTFGSPLGNPPFPGISTKTYPGPIPVGTPFIVFVKVKDVDMTAVAFVDAFVFDTTLTLTMSIP